MRTHVLSCTLIKRVLVNRAAGLNACQQERGGVNILKTTLGDMLSTWCRRCVLRTTRHKGSVRSKPSVNAEVFLHNTASASQSESDGERGGAPAGSALEVPGGLRAEGKPRGLRGLCCSSGYFFVVVADTRVSFRVSELKKLTDLRVPYNWYPAARSMHRRLIYHAGPTNSGKTYNAIQRFLSSGKAIYCAPLRMLAHEIYQKANEQVMVPPPPPPPRPFPF